jgi:hypothetical protein
VQLADHPELAKCLVMPLCGEPRVAYCYVCPDLRQQFERYVKKWLREYCEVYAIDVQKNSFQNKFYKPLF